MRFINCGSDSRSRPCIETLESRTLLAGTGDLAGDTIATAHNLGVLTEYGSDNTTQFNDQVGAGDPADWFKFKLDSASVLWVDLQFWWNRRPGVPMQFQLIRDADNDQRIDSGETVWQRPADMAADVTGTRLFRPVAAGTYYFRFASSDTNVDGYRLTMYQQEPLPAVAGPSPKAATDLNRFLDSDFNTKDYVTPGQSGWYRLRTGRDIAVDLSVFFDSRQGPILQNTLFRDADGDGPEAGEEFAADKWRRPEQGYRLLHTTLPAGDYYVRHRNVGTEDIFFQFHFAASFPGPEELNDALKFFLSAEGDPAVGLGDLADASDSDAFYFILDQPRLIELSSSAEGSNLPVIDLLQDRNLNGQVDAGEIIASVGKRISLVTTLGPGTYYYRVRSPAGPTSYRISTRFEIPPALTTLHNGWNWSHINTLNSGKDNVRIIGKTTSSHFHKLFLDHKRMGLRATLYGLSSDANLQLIVDRDFDGVIDPGEVLVTSARTGTSPESFDIMLEPGSAYYVRVISPSGKAVRYQLDLRAVQGPDTEPGIGFSTAADIQTRLPAYYMDAMFGGDRRDYYRLTLDTTTTIQILLESIRGDANFELLKDANNNGVRDDGELVGASANVSPALDQFQATLDAGVYYIRVYRATDVNTLYQFSIG